MRKSHMKIYASRKHVVATIFLVVLPFLFFLAFSQIVNIALIPLLQDIGTSFFRLVVAYLIAGTLGWGLAVIFYEEHLGKYALPFFDVLQSFPTFAMLPTAVYFFGESSLTVIFFLVVTVIWPIFFSVITTLRMTKREWEEAVHMAGLKGRSYLTGFLWPVSIPGLVTGSIIGLGEAWEALVATEIILHIPTGLGSFFGRFASSPQVTAFGILGFLILIFSINKLVWSPLLEKSREAFEE